MLSCFFQLLLTLDGPRHRQIAVKPTADTSGKCIGVFMIVSHKIRLAHKIEQQMMESEEHFLFPEGWVLHKGIRQLSPHHFLVMLTIPLHTEGIK